MNWEIWGGILAGVILFSVLVYFAFRFLKPKKTIANGGAEKETAESKRGTKEKRTSKSVWGWGFGIAILVLWVGFSVFQHFFPITGGSIIGWTSAGGNLSYDSVPAEIALPIIADCESGDGSPGSGKQFVEFVEEGGVVVRNINGTFDPKDDDIGKWQINLKHQANLIKELGVNVYTEEGNEKIAEELYRREKTKPWNRSRPCWEPKLAALGYGTGESQLAQISTVEAPVDKFSEEKTIDSGFFVSWGESSDEFIVRNQKGLVARYEPSKGIMENLPYPSSSISFKSLGEKPAIVKLRFSRTPLVKM